jgi:hypothetical protein
LVDLDSGEVLHRFAEDTYYDLGEQAFLPGGGAVRFDTVAAGTCGTSRYAWYATVRPYAQLTDGDVFWPVHELRDGRWLGWGIGDEAGTLDPNTPGSYRRLMGGADRMEATGDFVHLYDAFNVTEVVSVDPLGQQRTYSPPNEEWSWIAQGASGRWLILCAYAGPAQLGGLPCVVHDSTGEHADKEVLVHRAHRNKWALAGRRDHWVYVAPRGPDGLKVVRLDLVTGVETELAQQAGRMVVVGDGEAALVLAGARVLLVERDHVEVISETAALVVAPGRRGSALEPLPQSSQLLVVSRTSTGAADATRIDVVDRATGRWARLTDHGRLETTCASPGFVSDTGHPWLRRTRWIQLIDGSVNPPALLVVPADLSRPPQVVGPAGPPCETVRISPDRQQVLVDGAAGITVATPAAD